MVVEIMKMDDALPLLLLGGIAYFFATRDETSTTTATEAPFTNPGQQLYGVSTTTPEGEKKTVAITSVKQGVEFANSAYAQGMTIESPGATLVESNTRFEVAGKTYQTGSNQTVSRLADGQIKVLSVNPISKENSFFQKPIRTINGKRTRVY